MKIDPRFCWLCKKFDEHHRCGEVLGQCEEWKKFVNKAKAHQLKKKRRIEPGKVGIPNLPFCVLGILGRAGKDSNTPRCSKGILGWDFRRDKVSVSTKEFKERLKENKTRCFCGHKLVIGRDEVPYCPVCNAFQHLDLGGKEPKKAIGVVRFLNGKHEFIF